MGRHHSTLDVKEEEYIAIELAVDRVVDVKLAILNMHLMSLGGVIKYCSMHVVCTQSYRHAGRYSSSSECKIIAIAI